MSDFVKSILNVFITVKILFVFMDTHNFICMLLFVIQIIYLSIFIYIDLYTYIL